jgi:ABC-type multidrug transport system fused ATPase/permease subunit
MNWRIKMFNKIPKQINVVHLIYLSILFSVVLGFVIAIEFGPSPYAGEMLNFGATLSSIILAIVAILITLLDVVGQKSSILEIKESSKKIEEVMNKDEELMMKTEEQYHNLTTLTDQLANTMENNIELYTDVRKIVKESSDDKIDKNTLNSLIDEYEKKKDNPVAKESKSKNVQKLMRKTKIKRFILEEYNKGQFTIDDLLMAMQIKSMDHSLSETKSILKDLVWLGKINRSVYKGIPIYEVAEFKDEEDESN